MKTFSEYLQEQLLTEAQRDTRKNPPAFTPDQVRTNTKLFRDIGYTIRTAILKADPQLVKLGDEFGHIQWSSDTVNSDTVGDVSFVASYAVKGNRYYRNVIMLDVRGSRFEKKPLRIGTAIELLTDSVNNVVTLVFRKADPFYKKFSFADTSNPDFFKQLIEDIYRDVDRRLNVIAKSAKRTKIDTGTQYGYSWKLEEPDYNKCIGHEEIRSTTVTSTSIIGNQKDRLEKERTGNRLDNVHIKDELEKISKRVQNSTISAARIKASKVYDVIKSVADKYDLTLGGFDKWKVGFTSEGEGRQLLFICCNIRVTDKAAKQTYEIETTIRGTRKGNKNTRDDFGTMTVDDMFDKFTDTKFDTYAGKRVDQFEFYRVTPIEPTKDAHKDHIDHEKENKRNPANIRKFVRELANEIGDVKITDFPEIKPRNQFE